ncbi:hypothetical protein JCM9957A_33630 [Kineosporia succinea]
MTLTPAIPAFTRANPIPAQSAAVETRPVAETFDGKPGSGRPQHQQGTGGDLRGPGADRVQRQAPSDHRRHHCEGENRCGVPSFRQQVARRRNARVRARARRREVRPFRPDRKPCRNGTHRVASAPGSRTSLPGAQTQELST